MAKSRASGANVSLAKNATQKIRLQGIGTIPAVKASELRVGATMVWNYGNTERIQKITPNKSGKTLELDIISESGKKLKRRVSVDRLVGVR
jgi:hypothetical protein